jgi:outer membrane protein assembly factor BamA
MGVKFQGNKSIPATVLATGISTTNSGWFRRTPPFKWLGFLGEKRYFDERQFVADVLRLQFIYKASGFLEVKVDTVVQRSATQVKVTFKFTEGQPVLVKSLLLNGIRPVPMKSQLTSKLPLQVGKPFNRFKLAASMDSISHRLRNRGYPAVIVLKSFHVDSAQRIADVTIDIDPGPPLGHRPDPGRGDEPDRYQLRAPHGAGRERAAFLPGRAVPEPAQPLPHRVVPVLLGAD